MGTALAGQRAFGLCVASLAVLALADVTLVLRSDGMAAVVPAAAVPGIGAPALAVSQPDIAVARFPWFAAAGIITAFMIALIVGRRRDVSAAIAGTCLAALFVGLGTTALITLHAGAAGVRWTVGFLLLALLPDTLAGAARRVPVAGVRTVVVGVVAGALVTSGDPFTPAGVAALAGVALLAAEVGRRLWPSGERLDGAPRPGVSSIATAVLLGAPGALLWVRAVQA